MEDQWLKGMLKSFSLTFNQDQARNADKLHEQGPKLGDYIEDVLFVYSWLEFQLLFLSDHYVESIEACPRKNYKIKKQFKKQNYLRLKICI